MPIACTYCGESHATPTLVRECWQRHDGVEVAPSAPEREPQAIDGPAPFASAAVRPRSLDAPPMPRPGTSSAGVAVAPRMGERAVAGPGPDALGRGVVVAAGAVVPSPWEAAERIVIDSAVLADPVTTVARLRELRRGRVRTVIELAPIALQRLRSHPREVSDEPAHRLGPTFTFVLDELFHLVWSNNVDATDGSPVWSLLDDVVALGATISADGRADAVLPDGSPVWVDGGPISRHEPIDGVPVLHAICIEHGSLLTPIERTPASELAPDQLAAVVHDGAAARIIAPAGSGKTRVLTERARHLVAGWRTPSRALSLVAFNKRAQLEMQERTADVRGVQVRTLNAIALAIINGTAPFAPQSRTWTTIDEPEVRRIIGRLVQFPRRRNTDPVAVWIEALSAIRLGLRSPSDVESAYNGDVDGLADAYPRFRDALERAGAVDFDDQIARAIDVLLTDPDARAAAQRACRVLLVDEFQDLTPAHVLLVRLLSAPGHGVFGVGDDDQTIYGYSGARPEWLIDFAQLFPDAVAHPLEVNYRCPGDVVAAADRLVRHNRRRVPKVIRSIRPETAGLHVVPAQDTLVATLDIVERAVAVGTRPADIAVLVRVNALLAPVQLGLRASGIPSTGGVGREFLDRTAVRAALAWLRLAAGPSDGFDPSDLAEAVRRPSRPMHPNIANWVTEQRSVAGLRKLAGRITAERDAARVASFADDIGRMQRLAPQASTAELLTALADDIGLGASIATLDDGRHGMNRAAQNDDLVALGQLAALHPDPATFGSWLASELSAARGGADGVVLATVHRVKGQEWPLVVVHHADHDQFPHRLAEDLEEERRLFHVAITRGSAEVHVVTSATPSPFVAQMQQEPPERGNERDAPEPARRSGAATAAGAKPSRPTTPGGFVKGVVIAAPGLGIVDQGSTWTIEQLEETGAVARLDGVTRRFSYGSAVATVGRQRGPLRAAEPGGPSTTAALAFDLLRQARERLRNGKPAYVVFDDKTMEAIALALPTDLRALGRVPGIGPAKLEQYGDAILVAVEDAVQATARPDGTMPP